jgi:hypothetical protein
MLSFVTVIVTSCCFFLTSHREVADTFHISDDTGQVIDVCAVALRTFLEIVLADVAALVADGVRNVECKVVTSFLCSHAKKLAVLCLCKMFFKVKVKG